MLKWAPLAGERAAASGSHREAAAQYERALRFANGQAVERRAELLQRRADECYMTDQFDQAIAAQQTALECWRSLEDRRGRATRCGRCPACCASRARPQRRIEWRSRLSSSSRTQEPGHEVAIAYANVSHLCANAEDADGALTWGTRALELGERLDDTEVLVYALTNIGTIEFLAGEQQGHDKLARALELARNDGLEDHAGRAFVSLVLWPLRQRRLALARTYMEPGLDYCSERGLDTWRLYMVALRARLELTVGNWETAADAAATGAARSTERAGPARLGTGRSRPCAGTARRP